MDVYCPRCSEPWDLDTFHEVAEETDSTFDAVRADFYRRGCMATGWTGQCERTGSLRAEASAVLNDLLGDDIDGVASMLDDFDYLGMLE